MEYMAAEMKTIGADPEVLADLDTLMRLLAENKPVDPELSRRVEERADRAIEKLRQRHIQIDIDKLLQDVRDES
jgi:hypothetical protein